MMKYLGEVFAVIVVLAYLGHAALADNAATFSFESYAAGSNYKTGLKGVFPVGTGAARVEKALVTEGGAVKKVLKGAPAQWNKKRPSPLDQTYVQYRYDSKTHAWTMIVTALFDKNGKLLEIETARGAKPLDPKADPKHFKIAAWAALHLDEDLNDALQKDFPKGTSKQSLEKALLASGDLAAAPADGDKQAARFKTYSKDAGTAAAPCKYTVTAHYSERDALVDPPVFLSGCP